MELKGSSGFFTLRGLCLCKGEAKSAKASLAPILNVRVILSGVDCSQHTEIQCIGRVRTWGSAGEGGEVLGFVVRDEQARPREANHGVLEAPPEGR